MAEETTVMTNDGAATPSTEPVTTPAVEPATQPADPAADNGGQQPATEPGTEPTTGDGDGQEPATEPSAGDFSISDVEWPDELKLDDAAKTELFNNHKDLFKGKDEVNRYLKSLAEAQKINAEKQTARIREMEEGWEKELKTDSEFGKDYDNNIGLVNDTLKEMAGEKDFAAMEKMGFNKYPAFMRTMLKISRQFADARVVKGQQPGNATVPKTDSYGRTMFDFSKKQ